MAPVAPVASVAVGVSEISDPVDVALTKSQSTFRSPRMFDAKETDAVTGRVQWAPGKSLWITGMTLDPSQVSEHRPEHCAPAIGERRHATGVECEQALHDRFHCEPFCNLCMLEIDPGRHAQQ
jgi:hypothetical protein